MTEKRLSFSPNHDEAARQAFVGALKGYANIVVHKQLEAIYDGEIAPKFEAEHQRAPAARDDISDAVEGLPLYKYWGLLTYHSQDMLFDSVGSTVQRTKAKEEATARDLTTSSEKLGALHLDDAMTPSKPITDIEIHRQPGGYIRAENDDDLDAARLYAGTIEIYRNAKAMGDGSKAGSDSIGLFTSDVFRKHYPNKQPRRILDLGCGTGEQTIGFKRRFPEADVHGIDASAPFVRYAHAWAESEGEPITFHHMNAQETSFPDEHFDLIVSHILFHETSHKILPQIMAEAHRLLAPGGVMLNLDVPYQPEATPLLKQVTNHWQVRHNGEPFWTGFIQTDLKEKLVQSGFDREKVLYAYEGLGPTAAYLIFGGEK
ncbi:MAG: class I SAM-dependent methyltransferase [Pseudomonadota bacterium]